ncbi:RDD family protein [Amycolatopsis sp. K13G38]|uniref:RDD family protein n=1 Tax=Amycolatopsis acididurans TaxID=2724524 RepID=A0ABX1IXW2_9PSEU|nr:RDD family protein [Amycolatopsis acididurans]NKQ52332.1 RDD family protein [Amycolatopsis acididurans]
MKAYQGRPAGIVSRTVANVVDAGVVAVVLGVLYLAVLAVLFALDPVRFHPPVLGSGKIVPAGIGVAVLYLTVAWCGTGRTLGDQLLGLRVIDRHGRPPRVAVALVRAVTCVLFALGLLWVLAGARRRSVQDVLLRTSVIYDWNPHARPETSPVRHEVGPERRSQAEGTRKFRRR